MSSFGSSVPNHSSATCTHPGPGSVLRPLGTLSVLMLRIRHRLSRGLDGSRGMNLVTKPHYLLLPFRWEVTFAITLFRRGIAIRKSGNIIFSANHYHQTSFMSECYQMSVRFCWKKFWSEKHLFTGLLQSSWSKISRNRDSRRKQLPATSCVWYARWK